MPTVRKNGRSPIEQPPLFRIALEMPSPIDSVQRPDTVSGFSQPIPSVPVQAAYIHIPFCRRRCYYCDFPISVVGDRPPLPHQASEDGHGSGAIAQYVDILIAEIRATPAAGPALTTVFFGGGTPSLLSARQLGTLLAVLADQFGIAADAEISLEIDPGTFQKRQIQGFKAAGVNRLSLGVQSFEADLLAACGRTHTPEDITGAIALIHDVGIANFSIDLISGLPHQTLERWQHTLEKAVAIAPPHLSVYDLTVEPGTAFHRWYRAGQSPLPTDDATAEMYRLTQRLLTASGYRHYEISNYAKSGYQCLHNRVYWENRPYYGFGMGATSYVHRQRFSRPRTRQDYRQWVQAYVAHGGHIDCLPTPTPEILLDTLMLGLRLAEGLDLTELNLTFGSSCLEAVLVALAPFQRRGWVEIGQPQQGESIDLEAIAHSPHQRIRLTDPEGFLFSNEVLSSLFNALAEWFPDADAPAES
ncbi:MAG: radical SAM family heme chaperone HemW [Synechococcales bacterium]|nr:radical SAM family heme chaperone HemW [Synechococcales bacterium]